MNSFHVMGITLAVVIHGAIAGSAYTAIQLADQKEYPCSEYTLPDDAEVCSAVKTFRVIEASLAMKKESESKQPQKRRAQKRRKTTRHKRAINRTNAKANPTKKKKRSEDVSDKDVNDVLAKMRAKGKDENPEDLPEGKAALKTRGQFHGHKHGFADVNKGDPYVRRLVADVYNRWNVPTLEKGSGKTVGCIQLLPDGGIKAVKLLAGEKSGNQRFDASVEVALKKLQKYRNQPAHKKEVPVHLSEITTQWLCFKFNKKAD